MQRRVGARAGAERQGCRRCARTAAACDTFHHVHPNHSLAGCILNDDTALASAALTDDSVVTAVVLESIPSHAAPTALDEPYVSSPTGSGRETQDVKADSLSLESSAAPAASSSLNSVPGPSPTKLNNAHTPVLASAAAVQHGSRVRIQGLQAAPHMNGRIGVVYGALNQDSGRWAVDISADVSGPACRGTFRAGNLQVIAPHDFGREWVDEEGRVWPKNVDFSRECAKGHALAPLGDCSGDGAGVRLMCRLCHSFCARDSQETASWLTCSVNAGCCSGYVVCCNCAHAPSDAVVASSDSRDDFCTLVSCSACCML